jgi:hypothetical protein
MSVGTTKRKSIALSVEEFASLKQYAKQFNTGVECAESIGIHRNVLDRILLAGSGSPESIEKIRAALKAAA